jgi:hypothetical protein
MAAEGCLTSLLSKDNMEKLGGVMWGAAKGLLKNTPGVGSVVGAIEGAADVVKGPMLEATQFAAEMALYQRDMNKSFSAVLDLLVMISNPQRCAQENSIIVTSNKSLDGRTASLDESYDTHIAEEEERIAAEKRAEEERIAAEKRAEEEKNNPKKSSWGLGFFGGDMDDELMTPEQHRVASVLKEMHRADRRQKLSKKKSSKHHSKRKKRSKKRKSRLKKLKKKGLYTKPNYTYSIPNPETSSN